MNLDERGPAALGDAFRVALPHFEGPLDLLLHLIKEHKIDIFDVPIGLIVEKYVAYLEKMQEINIDVAGEFIVMAAHLAHIKSRLLLPRQAPVAEVEEEEQGDPRADLIRRLLAYQKYREAAERLARQDILDRDSFPRRVRLARGPIPAGETSLIEMSVYKLIEALDSVIRAIESSVSHEVVREKISISEAIRQVAERLNGHTSVSFYSVFEGHRQRQQIIITFLAILEMCRLKLLKVFQDDSGGDIRLSSYSGRAVGMDISEVRDIDYQG